MNKTNTYSTILGGCWREKVVSVFGFGHSKSHFRAPENGHFCQKGIFYKMVARRGKRPKNNFFFAFLVFFHIDTTYIKLEWNFENFLVHPSGQGILGQYVHLLKLGQYVTGTICRRTKCPPVQLEIHSLFIVIIMKIVSVFAYLCICVFKFAFMYWLRLIVHSCVRKLS